MCNAMLMMNTVITSSSLMCSLKESGRKSSKFVGIIGRFLIRTLSSGGQKSFHTESPFNLLL